MGLEALSRGAKWVDFVDTDRRVCQSLSEALVSFGAQARAAVSGIGADPFLQRAPVAYDLIFLDPPFADVALLHRTLHALGAGGWLAPGAMLYVEAHRDTDVPGLPGMLQQKEAMAGQVVCRLWRYAAQGES